MTGPFLSPPASVTHGASWLHTALLKHIVRSALQVSAVVGTILNIVNQGGAVLGGRPIAWRLVVMNFVVPYCVATYSVVRNERSSARRTDCAPE